MSGKGKPYLIQYLSAQGALLNKFKFVLNATTVLELKEKIREKLIGKDQLEKDQKIFIKDIEDFQLASDDEVDDVVPDGKLRVYLEKAKINTQVQPPQQQNSPVPQQQTTQPQQAVVTQSSPVSSGSALDTPIINLQNWTIPKISDNFPKDKVLKVICPQIRKSAFEIQANFDDISFFELSNQIITKFNLNKSLKALLFNSQGQPLLFNLDLWHKKVAKLDYSKTFYIMFTATSSPADQLPVKPVQNVGTEFNLKICQDNQSFTIKVDLDNTLSVLKYKIFEKTQIHPCNQIIKFSGIAMTNDSEKLSVYGLKESSIVELHFKIISNLIPASYTDKFYYKDVELLHPQDSQSLSSLKSNLLALGHHLQEQDKPKFLSFLREYSCNEPLVCALRTLFYGGFLSQTHRIALEEGFYTALWHFLKACNPAPITESKQLFTHTRDLLGFIFEGMSKPIHSNAIYQKNQQTILITNTCSLTAKPIVSPGFITLDDGTVVLIDRNQMFEQIDKGYTFPLLKSPQKSKIFDNQSLLENYLISKFNAQFGNFFSVVCWLGSAQKPMLPGFNFPQISTAQKYENCITKKYCDLKIHKALQIKNKSTSYLILTNKENQYRIFVSKNKDINKPHNIFDVISGKEESVNLDLMMAAGKTENLEEVVDAKDLKPVITREPKQAIVVLFDISGSMAGRFFNEPDLLRIGACKLFFQALAYRTIAYNFEHVVSLTFFDSSIEIQCDFTEAIYDFNRLVSAAQPKSTTRLYDSIVSAVNQLNNFKKRYPDCVMRIIALTDGEDVGSTSSIFDATKAVITNDIIIDSFVAGANCEGLKNITLATGGKCYLTGNMEESLKLFENQTVLSVRARQILKVSTGKSDAEIRQCLEVVKSKPFDLGNSVYTFKKPEIKGPGFSSKDIAKKYGSEEEQKKISGNSSLKRIAKQIQLYNENPHPFVSIYPCENINMWKILLFGPKETPYENGIYQLYASFPHDYPFRAPEVRFVTPIYHCNMNQQGRICHSVFDRNYSPALKFRDIIDSVYGLILTPEPEDPLDNVIASYFLSDYEKYLKNAREATLKNASPTTDSIVDQIYGKITDDIEKQKKIEEINKWIASAKASN